MSPSGDRTEVPCVFCQRVTRGEYEPTWLEKVVRFEPLNPVTPGHMLFVPKPHVPDAASNPIVTAGVMSAASEWVHDEVGEANIITSVGSAATQTVFHLHIHVVPRKPGDGLALPWTGQKKGHAT